MKRLMALAAVLAAMALFASAAPVSAKTAAFRHYVACGVSQHAKPSHRCSKRSKKGAFFRSNLGDVVYSVCVRFPSGRNLCARKQEATRGTLYVNKITSNEPGTHQVSWFVGGKRVGAFTFVVSG
jgi:opacity protein-like surface antigen